MRCFCMKCKATFKAPIVPIKHGEIVLNVQHADECPYCKSEHIRTDEDKEISDNKKSSNKKRAFQKPPE